MKILIVSDSHLYNDELQAVTEYYKGRVDLMVNCGDTALPVDHEILRPFDYVVKGNHDLADFPVFTIHNDIMITHGHYFNVYAGYDELVRLCRDNECRYCFHGHTHVPTHQVVDGIHFVNPGAIMMNRGSYGFATYALAGLDDNHFDVHFHHAHTHEIVDDIVLEEGLKQLEEFKTFVRKLNEKTSKF